MKLRLCPLLLTMLVACAGARTSVAAPPVRQCDPPPAEQAPRVDGLMSARISVPHHDVGALAGALRDIFHVRPDRGAVRAILDDRRDGTLFVIATREGLDQLRKLLALQPSPTSAS